MSKIQDGILGLAIGDALGVPFEFKVKGSFNCTDMVGYGTHNQPIGTWSDDTSMTLATMDSIIKCGGINYYDIMNNFKEWRYNNKFNPHDKIFDVGNTVNDAIINFTGGHLPIDCGGSHIYNNGNGSLMRILPLAFIDCTDKEIEYVSRLTHSHYISIQSCIIYVRIAKELLKGKDKFEAIKSTINYIDVSKELNRIKDIFITTYEDLSGGGYVVNSLEVALWCLLNTNNYKDCVLKAINLGGDTDTNGAIAGGLAGILYGLDNEKEWIDKLVKKDYIIDLCNKFEEVCNDI